MTHCPWWQVEFLPRRMLLAIWTLGSTVMVSGGLLVLGGGIIFAQVILLLFLALGPIWLLVALWWPEQGGRLIGHLLARAFGALAAQTLLAATLAVWLSLTLGVFAVFPAAGWIFHSLLLPVLAVVAIRYRYAWLLPLRALRGQRDPTAPTIVERTVPWMFGGRRRAAQGPVQGAGAGPSMSTAPAWIPAFAAISAPSTAIVRETVIREERWTHAGSTQPTPAAPAPRTEFQGQMQTLREHFFVKEQQTVQERITTASSTPAAKQSTPPTEFEPKRPVREPTGSTGRQSSRRPRL